MTQTQTLWRRFEGPTWLLALIIYGGFALTAAYAENIGLVFALPLLALLTAWQSSLAHECIHGHPTRLAWVNMIVGGAPLSPFMPYARYRSLHLAHHAAEELTVPGHDTETFFITPETWAALPQWRQTLLRWRMTLAGRLIFGPWTGAGLLIWRDAQAVMRGDMRTAGVWALHAVMSGALFWMLARCGIAWWQYILFCVWPAAALVAVRSFAEHRPAPARRERTAVVESGLFWPLLFLNNNLHALHHARPAAPWYDLPAMHRAGKDALYAQNGGYVFKGYGEIFRRFLFTAPWTPVHPGRAGPQPRRYATRSCARLTMLSASALAKAPARTT